MTLPSSKISAMIITYNEEVNISRTLASIQWIREILIVDSGSTDKTIELVNSFANTRVVHRRFDTFANQCNFGLGLASSEWILSLDADYVLTNSLVNEIYALLDDSVRNKQILDAYKIAFWYCINGKAIRSGLLPPRISLYKRSSAKYKDIGHGHKVIIDGQIGSLRNRILHDDRKSIWIWLDNQKRYQAKEAVVLSQANSSTLPVQDLIRKHTFLAPFISFFLCMILRGGLLDGKEGVIYALQRVVAESLLYLSMHSEN